MCAGLNNASFVWPWRLPPHQKCYSCGATVNDLTTNNLLFASIESINGIYVYFCLFSKATITIRISLSFWIGKIWQDVIVAEMSQLNAFTFLGQADHFKANELALNTHATKAIQSFSVFAYELLVNFQQIKCSLLCINFQYLHVERHSNGCQSWWFWYYSSVNCQMNRIYWYFNQRHLCNTKKFEDLSGLFFTIVTFLCLVNGRHRYIVWMRFFYGFKFIYKE